MDEQEACKMRYSLRENSARSLSLTYPSDTRAFWVGFAKDLLTTASGKMQKFVLRERAMKALRVEEVAKA